MKKETIMPRQIKVWETDIRVYFLFFPRAGSSVDEGLGFLAVFEVFT